MHSVSNPTEEANELYIKQSKLSERLISINPPDQFQQEEQTNPLVIWDVGLGEGEYITFEWYTKEELTQFVISGELSEDRTK